jgi:hypothetical protein
MSDEIKNAENILNQFKVENSTKIITDGAFSFYTSFVKSGFSKSQSLEMVKLWFQTALMAGMKNV